MLNAFRLAKTTQNPSTTLISTYTNLPYNITRKPSNIRFAQAASGPNQEMNPKEEPESKARDTMSSSFGEGYATRSDEEGFGGIYGRNQYLSKDEEDRDKDPKHAQRDEKEFDHSQGSEVKEKEEARNQSKAVTN